jgi:hypothetical protein
MISSYLISQLLTPNNTTCAANSLQMVNAISRVVFPSCQPQPPSYLIRFGRIRTSSHEFRLSLGVSYAGLFQLELEPVSIQII